MTNKMVRFYLILIIGFVGSNSFAQKGEEIGGWIGSSFYYGDLNTSLSVQKPSLSFGIIGKRNFNNRLSLRGGLSYSRIRAADSNSSNNFEKNRNLSFRTDIVDLSGGIEFNFLEHNHGSVDAWYTPYIFVGASIFYYNPTAKLDGKTYSLRDMGTEGQAVGDEYSTFSASLILSTGFKWDIGKDISLFTELTFRKLFTDYIDDVSKTYPNFNQLQSERGDIAVALSDRSLVDGLAIPGRQRGNSRNNDTYVVLSIGISKYFGHIQCPKISSW